MKPSAESLAALKLPAWFDSHAATVGSSGAGKTVTAKRKVERLLEAGRHVAVIDPTGAWWGLQSNAAGDGPGFDIPIFGGLHGNIPITPADGAAVANVIVTMRISAIVDLSEIHDAAGQRQFMAGFIGALRGKPQANFHLVVDEADEFCPQTAADSDGFALLNDIVWIAKRGRLRGFVLDVITQRPADISKQVLSQMQTIVAHQLVAPQDQAAIDAYLKAHGSKATRDEVMKSLPSLDRGERWVYSPRLAILERGVTPPLSTFDSSATPAPGEEHATPRAWSDIDAGAIAAALQAARPASPASAKGVAGPSVDTAALDAAQATIAEYEARFDRLRLRATTALGTIDAVINDLGQLRERLAADFPNIEGASARKGGEVMSSATSMPEAERGARSATGRGTGSNTEGAAKVPSASAAPVSPIGPERKPLAVLVGFAPAGLTEASWATVAGFKRTGGTWKTYRSRLSSAGMIEPRGDKWFATDLGAAAVGEGIERPPAPGPELVAFWADRVPGAGRMLKRLGQLYPAALTRDALAAELGMSPDGGSFKTYLSRLRGNGLLEEKGKRIRVAPALMGDIA